MKSPDATADEAKRRVGVEAAREAESGMVVGLGTGSTASHAIRELGRRVREEGLDIVGVATSFSATLLAREVGLRTVELPQVDRVDLALDGADEVDPALQLIKGGGAAHTMEKVIDGAATRFLALVDDSKMVATLGEGFAVPVEVLAFARGVVRRRLEELGASVALRVGTGKDGPVVTDLGNLVLDAKFPAIPDPVATAGAISQMPGVVEHGLFVGLAHEVWEGDRATGELRKHTRS